MLLIWKKKHLYRLHHKIYKNLRILKYCSCIYVYLKISKLEFEQIIKQKLGITMNQLNCKRETYAHSHHTLTYIHKY